MILTLLALLVSSAQAATSPPAPGLYLNSEGSPLFQLLQSASTSIDIEIYTMSDKQLRASLRAALAKKVKIRIVKDPNPLGEACDLFFGTDSTVDTASEQSADCQDQRKLVTQIKAVPGNAFIAFDKSKQCPNGGGKDGQSCFEHGKIVVADQKTALVSTGNFDNTNFCIAAEHPATCNRDWTVINTDNTVVSALETIFTHDLQDSTSSIESLIPSNVMTASPFSEAPLVAFIETAHDTIDIETQYLKDPAINNALIAAAKNGKKVSVTVASIAAFGTPSAFDAGEARTTYSQFDEAGISSMMFDQADLINGVPGYMHAKAIVLDGNRAWVGSENGSTTSMSQNREYGVFFDDAGMVQKLLTVIRQDHDNSASETWQESLACKMDTCKATATDSSNTDPTSPKEPTPPKKPRKPRKPPPTSDI
jgi:phosphatidylserine/phosphatidylglycerophosphate/cardiolipin synthase-like enzyme